MLVSLILGLTPKEIALLSGIRKRKSELLIEIQVQYRWDAFLHYAEYLILILLSTNFTCVTVKIKVSFNRYKNIRVENN